MPVLLALMGSAPKMSAWPKLVCTSAMGQGRRVASRREGTSEEEVGDES